jgi:hypothetical protein
LAQERLEKLAGGWYHIRSGGKLTAVSLDIPISSATRQRGAKSNDAIESLLVRIVRLLHRRSINVEKRSKSSSVAGDRAMRALDSTAAITRRSASDHYRSLRHWPQDRA